jgi:membrane protein YqaA with SNARE-associated domain
MIKKPKNMTKRKYYSKSQRLKDFFLNNKPLIYFWLIIVALLIIVAFLRPVIESFVMGSPELRDTYLFVKGQLDKNSMLWLFIISFLGSLFFITLTTDIFFFFFIVRGADPLQTVFIYMIAVVLGRVVNYWIGYLFSGFVTRKVLKQDYHDFNKKYSKIESSVLFFGNFIPLFPTEFYIAFLGTVKYDFWKVLLYNTLGKLIKLLFIAGSIEFVINNLGFFQINFFDEVKMFLEALLP